MSKDKQDIQVTGEVTFIGEVEKISDKFTKQTIAIKTNDDYPQEFGIDFVNDKVKLVESLKVKDGVTVSVNLRGREWRGKYFTSLNGWRIESGGKDISSKGETDLPF
jgi:hypothetical protein